MNRCIWNKPPGLVDGEGSTDKRSVYLFCVIFPVHPQVSSQKPSCPCWEGPRRFPEGFCVVCEEELIRSVDARVSSIQHAQDKPQYLSHSAQDSEANCCFLFLSSTFSKALLSMSQGRQQNVLERALLGVKILECDGMSQLCGQSPVALPL